MSDLNAFRHETRDWLEANCPPSMRESTQGGEEMCWGGRNFEFASEEQMTAFLDAHSGGTAKTLAALDDFMHPTSR